MPMPAKQPSPYKPNRFLDLLTLLTSSSTLICCALPALLVGIGAGATLVSLTTAIPQLIWISEHKVGVFIFASIMIALSGWLQWRARHLPCPIDPTLAKNCATTRKRALCVYAITIVLYAIGGFFAFILPLLTE